MGSVIGDLVADVLRIPAATVDVPGATFDKVPTWDSMARIDLIVSLEDRYGLELSHEEIASIRGVDDIRFILKRRGVTVE